MTKVLMISTDAKILSEGTDVRARMRDYGELFDELHIIVVARRKGGESARIEIGQRVFAYPTRSRSRLWYIHDAWHLGRRIIRERKLSPADSVITAQDPFETGLVGALLSKWLRLPLHIQIHTDFMSPLFRRRALDRARASLAPRVLSRARAVRAVSERVRASLPAEIRAKASVLPIYVDLAAISAPVAISDIGLRGKYSRFDRIALAASRLSPEKDIEAAIRAFALARRSHPRAGFVIVGDGPERARLGKLAESLAEGSIAFEPWAERSALFSYLRSCDAFVSSSLYEGYGLSMLEAHAAGAHLVATDAGIAAELSSRVCPPGRGVETVACLAEALSDALAGKGSNRAYAYPYASKKEYLRAFKADIERTAGKTQTL